jgi:hypothetical protein
MNKLTKAVFIAATGTVLAIGNTHASADVLLSKTSRVRGAESWNGGNRSDHSGWGHTVDWLMFKATDTGTIDIKMTGSTAVVQPAFTVWNIGATDQFWTNGHNFSQINNVTIGTASGSFVGFANNNSGDAYFGAGPNDPDPQHSGAAALTGTTAQIGVDGSGNHFAELIFPNFNPDTWYAIAAGGSGGLTGNYTITANLTAVPVPAAVWLFGSVMVGLIGVNRRNRSV